MYLATVEAAYFCSGRKAMNGANVLIGGFGYLFYNVYESAMDDALPLSTQWHSNLLPITGLVYYPVLGVGVGSIPLRDNVWNLLTWKQDKLSASPFFTS